MTSTPALETARLVSQLDEFFRSRGLSAYIVGGFVRDTLLGRPTADLDVAVATSDVSPVAADLAALLHGTPVTLDAERQVYRVVVPAGHADLTPLRGGSIEADLALRDFTINAMAVPMEAVGSLGAPSPLSPQRGEYPASQPGERGLIDPLGGRRDLEAGTVRAVSAAVFQDDPLRLMRGVRLAVELGFTLDTETSQLMAREAAALTSVAGERVRDEFCRILAAPGVAGSLRLLDSLGLLTTVIPELEESRDVEQPKEHYWDVLQHSLASVGFMEQVLRQSPGPSQPAQAGLAVASPPPLAANSFAGSPAAGTWLDAVPWDEDLAVYFAQITGGGDAAPRTRVVMGKLAALLHDVSKPATKVVAADGRMSFHGHPVKGAAVTEQVMGRLRFTNRETRMVSAMVEEHLRPILISRDGTPSRRALYRFFRDAEDVVVDTLFLSYADYLAARGPMLEDEDWVGYSDKIRYILNVWREQATDAPPAKIIDGHEIMRVFRLPPGPHIGRLLEEVREGHAAGELKTKEEALALVRRLLKNKKQKKIS